MPFPVIPVVIAVGSSIAGGLIGGLIGYSKGKTKAEENKSPPESTQQGSVASSSQVIISSLLNKDEIFQLAQVYQVGHQDVEIDLNQSFDLYMMAAKMGHQEAWDPLERLGEDIAPEKQLALGELFKHFHKDEKAATWTNKGNEPRSFSQTALAC